MGDRGTVGICIPAISRKTGLVKNANSTRLIGHPLDKDLRIALHREVRVENDANCFALSEAADGAGAAMTLCSASSREPVSAAASSSEGGFFPGRMASPANGDTIPCQPRAAHWN